MRFEVQGAFGDEYATTAVVREYKLQHPNELVKVTNFERPPIWENNPYKDWGDADNGRSAWLYSWEPRHVGPRSHHYYEIAGCAANAKSDLPELYFTPQELSANLWLSVDPTRTIAIDPNAGWSTRVWKAEKYHALSAALTVAGYDVLHVGAPIDRPLEGSKFCVGRWSIRQLAVLLSRCGLFVGNDSGLFHIAASVGVPHAIILGVSRFASGPYSTTTPITAPTLCSRYCGQNCVREGDLPVPHNFCMNEITVKQVYETCIRTLETQRGRWRLRPSIDVIGTRPIETLIRELDEREDGVSLALSLVKAEAPVIGELKPWTTYREGAPTPVHAAFAAGRRGRVYPIVESKVDAICLQAALGKDLKSVVNPILGPSKNLAKLPQQMDLLYARDTRLEDILPILPRLKKTAALVVDAAMALTAPIEQWLQENRWKPKYRGQIAVWTR
jgi:hypothetical protein